MLGVIANRFSIGKETYEPFAAELHYFRVDKRYWSICFERIKRAGFRIIATAVPWNVHQIDNKTIDFNGFDDPRRDLIVFLELAREFGFKVILRPGPWVAGQVPSGGLPKFIFNDPKVLAKNAAGQEVRLPDDHGVDGGLLPSYLHGNFLFYLRNYFKEFIGTTKNYVHPRGPVFMVELDYETSFGRMLQPGSADYNPDIVATHYPDFLQRKYQEIKQLNAAYREKNSDFTQVDPPRQFADLELKAYPKILDWFRFREEMLQNYLQNLEDVFKAYTVEPLLFRSLYFRSGDLLPAYNIVPSDRSPFLGANVFPEGSYFDLINKGRFLKAEYGFAYATSFVAGRASADPDRESRLAPVTNGMRRFQISAALASGFKGFNHYMFVNRDRWYGAPLNADGTVGEGYELVRALTNALNSMGFDEMNSDPDIAILGNRTYSWLSMTQSGKEFTYLNRLLQESTIGFCRDLVRLKIPYAVRESRDFDELKRYKLLFAPCAEIMAEADQTLLVELAKAGVSIVLCGLLPQYDEEFRPCSILANHLKMKTTAEDSIGLVASKSATFPARLYGSIRATDEAKTKKLASIGAKVVAVSSNRFKGSVYFFSFDFASGGNHQRLAFTESFLAGEKIETAYYSSDPSVDLAFQKSANKALLAIVAPPAGELGSAVDSGQREIIVQVDLKKLGFAATNIKLTNIFDGEGAVALKSSAKELAEGMSLTMNYPDGCLFLIEKR